MPPPGRQPSSAERPVDLSRSIVNSSPVTGSCEVDAWYVNHTDDSEDWRRYAGACAARRSLRTQAVEAPASRRRIHQGCSQMWPRNSTTTWVPR